ncbi:MAG: PAS domain S-box protein [Chthoniobacteraceae bacterium]
MRVIVLCYMGVAAAWMLLGNHIGLGISGEDWPVAKALFFVLATGGMLYLLIYRFALRLSRISESLRASENKYRLLIENSPDAVVIERGGLIVFGNPAALALFGAADASQLLGQAFSSFVALTETPSGNEQPPAASVALRKMVRLDGHSRDVEISSVAYSDPEGRCVKHILRDISEREQKDQEIRRLNRIYSVLSQVNQAVVRIPSREKLFAQICNILIHCGGFTRAWVGRYDPQKREVIPVAWEGQEMDHRIHLQIGTPSQLNGGLVERVILDAATCVSNDYVHDPRTVSWHDRAARENWHSVISLPIRRHREICGVLTVVASEVDYFQHEEIRLLEEVAMDVSFALDRLDEEELRRKTQEALVKSEEHLRFLINHLHAGVMVVSSADRVVMINSEVSRLLGQPREEIVGRTPGEFGFKLLDESGEALTPGQFPSSWVIASGQPLQSRILGVTQPAGTVWLHVNAFPERDGQGTLRQVIVTFVDISAHKQAMEAVRESEEKFRTLFASSRDAILLFEDNSYFDCNQAALEMFRCPEKTDLLKRKLGDLSAIRQPGGRYSAQVVPQLVETALRSGLGCFEWMCRRLDGTEFMAEMAFAPIVLRGRTVMQVVVRDISWRRQAEQQLRQLSRVVEQSPISVVITDIFGNIQYVNPKFTESTGYTREEVIGNNPRMLKSGELSAARYEELWNAITSGQEWRGEFHNRKKNGELFWQSASISPITNKAGAITQFLAIEEDITDRKRTEAALKESEERFFKAFNTAPAIMVIMTLGEGLCIEVNNAFVEASGYTRQEALGRHFRDLGIMDEPDIDAMIAKLQSQGKVVNEECGASRKNGEKLIGIVSADLIEINGEACVVATMLDITERKQMEEKFLRVQRMESIGALAGGMAHDLNNILAPILMSASMLRDQKLSDPSRQLVSGIEEAAQRGANIVNQVLTFARGVKGKHTVINASELAGEIAKMVKEIFPKSIIFSFNVPSMLWNISGDTTQLQQVFLNLCVNARDAMLEGGSLTLGVDNIEVDEAFAHMVPSATAGRYVQFSVTDTGTGIPPKIVDRIFEPFFTTKEPGKGTGLGLSTAVGIVRSHGGFLKVESEIGKGSIFRVYIPATNSAVRKKEKTDQPAIIRGNGETLLVVDDEPEILEIICSILQQNNWKTISATDGVEGVASFLMHSGKIKALITDMVMPNMDGLGLIRSVRKLSPDLPILVASGFSNEESRGELDEQRISGFLKKPFSARQLVARVASLLYDSKGKPLAGRK